MLHFLNGGDSGDKIHPLTHIERPSYNRKVTSPALTHNFPTALSAASDICTPGASLSGVFPITSAGQNSFSAPLFTQGTSNSGFLSL